MSEFINTIDVLGDDAVIDSLIDGSITELKDNQITTIGTYAFCNNTIVDTIDCPNVTSIKNYAFSGCTSIKHLTFPNLISANRWNNENNVFENCKGLESVCLPSLKALNGQYYFYGCTGLKIVDMPSLEDIDQYTGFSRCYSLTRVNMPKLIRAIPVDGVFNNCTSLASIDLPSITRLGAKSFIACSAFSALILRNETVCTLDNTNAFTSTPIASGTGYIYVPSALVDSYKTANNWSTYASQIRAIEDWTVDGTVTGDMREYCESLAIDITELTFTDANTQTLTATRVLPGILDQIVWSSSDKRVATVENGVVTPISDGTAIITVTCGNYSATCTVTVNAGLELQNILQDISFNAGYIDNNGSITSGGANDTYTTKFDISSYAGSAIIVTLLAVASNPTYSRICYYNESESIIGYAQGAAGSGCVTITSTVPDSAVYAAISVNKSSGFSGIEITCDDVVIGSVEYTS